MKNISLILITSFLFLIEPVSAEQAINKSSKLHIATFNIRVQTPADTASRSWDKRKTDVAKIIKQYKFDIFGVQEVANPKQENDLKALIPAYTYIGKGRDNNEGTLGEQIGIFYKTSRFKLRDTGFFFLSETPDKMSMGWDGAYRRICVWAHLYDRQSKRAFFVFSTHFDHIGTKARTESAKLIVERINILAGESPVFCLGDLNASPESTEMYNTLTSFMDDSREISVIPAKGSSGTFNGYDMSIPSFTENARIDYIFCRKVQVLNYNILTDKYSKESYPSDHFPVMIECKISR